MIYLFCNNRYGSAFIKEFVGYSRIPNSEKRIVFSAYRRRPASNSMVKLQETLIRSKSLLVNSLKKLKLSRMYHVNVSFVADVNAAIFSSQILPGDHGIISGFNQIFRAKTIECFDSLVNFHPSILPLYRGPVPSYWCIRNRETYTGFTLHKVAPEIDQGEVLYQGGVVDVGAIKDPDILDERIGQLASQVMVEYLDGILGFGQQLEKKILNASELYKCNVDYASFPREN